MCDQSTIFSKMLWLVALIASTDLIHAKENPTFWDRVDKDQISSNNHNDLVASSGLAAFSQSFFSKVPSEQLNTRKGVGFGFGFNNHISKPHDNLTEETIINENERKGNLGFNHGFGIKFVEPGSNPIDEKISANDDRDSNSAFSLGFSSEFFKSNVELDEAEKIPFVSSAENSTNETNAESKDYGHEKCHTSYKTVYKTVYETSYKKKCHTTYSKKCHTEYYTTYKKKCSTSYSKKCHTSYKTIYKKKCNTYYDEKVCLKNLGLFIT